MTGCCSYFSHLVPTTICTPVTLLEPCNDFSEVKSDKSLQNEVYHGKIHSDRGEMSFVRDLAGKHFALKCVAVLWTKAHCEWSSQLGSGVSTVHLSSMHLCRHPVTPASGMQCVAWDDTPPDQFCLPWTWEVPPSSVGRNVPREAELSWPAWAAAP